MTDDPLAVAREVGAALDRVGASWAVGGSLASSVHGVPRTTADVDFIVAFHPSLAAAFSAYDVFHQATTTKVDLFPAIGAFERNQLRRASVHAGVRVISAEDAVLAKLRWFRAGGGTSDRQWRDVLGVLEVQRLRLDIAHLTHWAGALGVADLLTTALSQHSAGI